MIVLVAAPIWVVAAAPAGADVVSPAGACRAIGVWKKAGITLRTTDHKSGDVITIPRHDIVAWKGFLKNGKGHKTTTRRDIAGSLDIDLPLGQSHTIDTWDKTSVRTAKKGRRGYSLPSFVTGVKFKLAGHHDESGKQVCSGSVYMKVKGSGTSNPLFWASVVGIVVGLAGLLLSGRQVVDSGDPLVENSAATPRGHGRRVLGAIGGFILGGSIGALLLPLGTLPLDSILLLVLPIVGLVIGLAFAWMGPLGSRAR
ncbi:MAG: hypothetical protein JO291_01705 [Acidimicrobiia bacterium]|nr:hypothetical protein [Acidimicrobiia bacterium]